MGTKQKAAVLMMALGMAVPGVRAGTSSTYVGLNGNWNVGANWSTNPVVPLNSGGTTFDAFIVGRAVTYNISGSNAVDSLTLSGATLTLTPPAVNFSMGLLSATASTISLTGSTLTAANASLDSVSLLVNSSGSFSLPGLTTYAATTASGTFQATAFGTHLLLPSLTKIALSSNGFTARAISGGNTEFNGLTQISSSGSSRPPTYPEAPVSSTTGRSARSGRCRRRRSARAPSARGCPPHPRCPRASRWRCI